MLEDQDNREVTLLDIVHICRDAAVSVRQLMRQEPPVMNRCLNGQVGVSTVN